MPGLVAIVGRGDGASQQRLLMDMLRTMQHEDSYAWGAVAFADGGVSVGWVAHEGSFAEHVSRYEHQDGSVVIFCGEAVGRLPGVVDRSLEDANSFAAALIEGTRAKGADYLRNLNGLFSGVLVDRSLRRTLVFNDRFGAERIYHLRRGENWLFSTEAKALLRVEPASRSLHPEAVAQWIKFGSVTDDRSLFTGVELLPGASVVVAGPRGIENWGRYFDRAEWEAQPPLSLAEFSSALTETVSDVVPNYLSGPKSIGFAITGGLDTRMIAAALPEKPPNLCCYTYGVAGTETLDQRIGRQVASLCGLTHHSVLLDDSWLDQFPRHLARTVWITDGCAGATTAHELPLTQKSKALGAVRLTGNFGSEVLRGVSTMKPWMPAPGLLNRDFAPFVSSAKSPDNVAHPVTRSAFQEVPWHLFGTMAAARSQVTFRTPYLDNAIVKLAYRLPVAERRSPIPSTDVINRLKPCLMMIPTDRGVSLRSSSMVGSARRGVAEVLFKLDYWDKEGLPGSLWAVEPLLGLLRSTPLLGQHKYLAYRRWFKGRLARFIEQVAAACDDVTPYVDRGFVDRMALQHASGRHNLLREISCVLTLSTIQRLFVRGDGFATSSIRSAEMVA